MSQHTYPICGLVVQVQPALEIFSPRVCPKPAMRINASQNQVVRVFILRSPLQSRLQRTSSDGAGTSHLTQPNIQSLDFRVSNIYLYICPDHLYFILQFLDTPKVFAKTLHLILTLLGKTV